MEADQQMSQMEHMSSENNTRNNEDQDPNRKQGTGKRNAVSSHIGTVTYNKNEEHNEYVQRKTMEQRAVKIERQALVTAIEAQLIKYRC